jgi:arylsulfatase A-like enzyme
VLILADDLGWTDAGFAGSRFYETPHLDALAAGSVRFTSFYASHSGPSTRASLLTGEYAVRTGVYAADTLAPGSDAARRLIPPPNRTSLKRGSPTVASVLKAAGYATGFVGQWQLGTEAEAQPTRFGFDEAVLATDQYTGFEVSPPMELPAGTHHADFVADQAVEFLARHREHPFLLVVSHLAVRAPVVSKPEWIARFEKKAPSGGHRDAAYAAAIAGLDESVGRVLAGLETLNLTTNTVVMFTSDNGGVGGYPETEAGGRRLGVTDNAPLRGGQGMFYEGGLRVPFLVRWPGVTPRGSKTTQPGIHVDLLPTLCEIAAVRPPSGHPLDGVSLVPLFRDPNGAHGRDALYWHFPGYVEAFGRPGWRTTPLGVARAGIFKVIEYYEDGRLELYNVAEDLGEKNNLVRSLPEKAKELQAKLAAWRKSVEAPMPEPKPGAPAPAAPAPARP